MRELGAKVNLGITPAYAGKSGFFSEYFDEM